MTEKKVLLDILILSGGSLRGIAHIGALAAMGDRGILGGIKTIASTSVGTMVSVLYAIGYTPAELIEFLSLIDFRLFNNIKFGNFLSDFGVDDCKKLMHVFEKMFEAKEVSKSVTLLELFRTSGIELIITGTCINDKKAYYFSHETYPNMPVLMALRASISIPFWFTPVKYDGKMFIDGGIIDNYPIGLFRGKWDRVIGVYLNEERERGAGVDNFEDFFVGTMECIFEGMNIGCVAHCMEQTINLTLPKASMIGNMSLEEKKTLYDIGYRGTIEYLDRRVGL